MDRNAIIDEFASQGCNCCQAVCMAFENEFDIPREEIMVLSAAFGGGLGYYGLTCGALAGAAMVFGNRFGADFINDKEYKAVFYAAVKDLAEKFAEENGDATCAVLKQLRKDSKGYSCRELMYRAADLAERYIEKYSGTLRDRKAK